MIKISNDEPVIFETSSYRFEFANLEMALRPRTDLDMIRCAQRVYDKKNCVYIKERFVGPEVANAILNFAIGVNP